MNNEKNNSAIIKRSNVIKHKQINIKKSKKCMQENCSKMSHFNFPTETQALYCCEHKRLDMIDVRN